MLLKTVSMCLKDGGYFIGIALDGAKVKQSVPNNEIYTIIPENSFNGNGPYNCAYRFFFNNKNENNDYFAFRGDMIEYLVSLEELDSVAKTFDLERVCHTYLNTDVPVLKMDVVFKYVYKTHKKNLSISYNKKFFPSKVSNLNLKILPETSSVCSRPEASSLLVNIIKNLNIDVQVLVDATAHVGSDTIALALCFQNSKVISIEIQEETIQALRHNILECKLNNVIVIHDDCLNVLQKDDMFIDVLYIDAPWGGVDYKKKNTLSLYISDTELSDVIKTYRKRVKFFVLKLHTKRNSKHYLFLRFPAPFVDGQICRFLKIKLPESIHPTLLCIVAQCWTSTNTVRNSATLWAGHCWTSTHTMKNSARIFNNIYKCYISEF